MQHLQYILSQKKKKDSYKPNVHFTWLLFGAVFHLLKLHRGTVTRTFPISPSVSQCTTSDTTSALCHTWCITGSPRSGPGLHLMISQLDDTVRCVYDSEMA